MDTLRPNAHQLVFLKLKNSTIFACLKLPHPH